MNQNKSYKNIARDILTSLYFLSVIFLCGSDIVLGRIGYTTWELVGAKEFPSFHRAIVSQTFKFLPYWNIGLLLSIIMIWMHPRSISKVLVIIVALILIWEGIATTTMTIPIHKQLDHSKSQALLDKLISLDLYYRILPAIVCLAIIGIMLYQLTEANREIPAVGYTA